MAPSTFQSADDFLARARQLISGIAPAPSRAVACAIARRHIEVLREDAGPLRAIVSEVVDRGASAPSSELGRWDACIAELQEMIDPDRVDAMDKRRALGVVRLALASCVAPPVSGAGLFDVVRAALASRALRPPATEDAERVAEREALRERWSWDAVRDEARWLAAELERPPGPPGPPAPSRPPGPPGPPPAAREEAARVLALPLGEATLRLIGVEGSARFRAEVDGRRCLLRSRVRHVEVSTGGVTGDEPPWAESTTTDASALVTALAGGAVPVRHESGRTLVETHRAGAHFRQNDWTRVWIALTTDGVVEIETVHASQDESYY